MCRNMLRYMLMTLTMLCLTDAQSGNLETLLMPGKVILGHAELEEQCQKCHNRFDKTGQNSLCLHCHEEIQEDLAGQSGYHGRNPVIETQACKTCHTEHKGRDADIVALNTELFNHDLTDFQLQGAHIRSDCGQCHQHDTPYRETAHECIACHREQDIHDEKLGANCNNCHTQENWQKTRFDHDETKFKLKGKHKRTACSSCHLQSDYKKTPADCIDCHRSNDVHLGRNGDDCTQCHSSTVWDETRFDHNLDTEFKLLGKHRKVTCESCHQQAINAEKPKTDCYSCHKIHDQHQGRFGKTCADCHAEKAWDQPHFDHQKNTKYPLLGKHRELSCLSCHRGDLKKDQTPKRCIDCHRTNDVHGGQQGENCSDCHGELRWNGKITFDHDLTRFPLLGLHATTPCEECHLNARFKDTESECIKCHENNNPHQQSLGRECQLCHNPNAWELWQFDHDIQTKFPLKGKHQNLACEGCHRGKLSHHNKLSGRCDVCHAQEDIHQGGFGHQCERCHSAESFSDVRLAQ